MNPYFEGPGGLYVMQGARTLKFSVGMMFHCSWPLSMAPLNFAECRKTVFVLKEETWCVTLLSIRNMENILRKISLLLVRVMNQRHNLHVCNMLSAISWVYNSSYFFYCWELSIISCEVVQGGQIVVKG